MIWNETPFGCVIKDEGYLAFCNYLESVAGTSISRFCKLSGIDLWGMTPNEARRVLDRWRKKQDDDAMRDWHNREYFFWESCTFSDCHPPATV